VFNFEEVKFQNPSTMNTKFKQMVIATIIFAGLLSSCKKNEAAGYSTQAEIALDSATITTDSVSMAATQNIKDKQFIKTANVNMDVKNVYESTISIENYLKKNGGFVTNSNLRSNIISEDSHDISSEKAMLIKKYTVENQMQVRVPTEKLGEFLQFIHQQNLFLNQRTITADDVTSNIKLAKLEQNRIQKTESNISQLKTNKDKVQLADQNASENNQLQVANFNIEDQLKYSTVDIYIKEPKTQIAEIEITNTNSIDNKYKYNFFFEAENAIVDGYYFIQETFIFLLKFWAFFLVSGIGFYFWKKRKTKNHNTQDKQNS
jgi:hypothetical protein